MKFWRVFLIIMLLDTGTKAIASENTDIPAAGYFPLKIHPNGKHLRDANRKPFLMVADVAWQMLRKLSYAEAVNYMDILSLPAFVK